MENVRNCEKIHDAMEKIEKKAVSVIFIFFLTKVNGWGEKIMTMTTNTAAWDLVWCQLIELF